MNKNGFIIIFHRYFFYAVGVFLLIYFAYGYFDDKGYVTDNSFVYGAGRLLGAEPADARLVEQKIFQLANEERQNAGLKPLVLDNKLSLIAQEHSQDMHNRNFFDHDNPDGDGPTERAEKKGIPVRNGMWIGIAENIGETPIGDVIGCGYVSSEEDVAKCAVDGWMSSPGHRANILNTNYDVVGVGTYCTTSTCFNTQDFR